MLGNGINGTIVRRPDRMNPNRCSANIAFNSISDGLSNTILFSERAINNQTTGTKFIVDDSLGWFEGWDWDVVRYGRYQPVQDYIDKTATNWIASNQDTLAISKLGAFGSAHTGRMNSLFSDGSVRNIGYEIKLSTFGALTTRNGGEVISD